MEDKTSSLNSENFSREYSVNLDEYSDNKDLNNTQDDLNSFLSYISKITNDSDKREKNIEDNDYVERKTPIYMDVQDIDDTYSYGDSSSYGLTEEQILEKKKNMRMARLEENLEKNISNLELKFANKDRVSGQNNDANLVNNLVSEDNNKNVQTEVLDDNDYESNEAADDVEKFSDGDLNLEPQDYKANDDYVEDKNLNEGDGDIELQDVSDENEDEIEIDERLLSSDFMFDFDDDLKKPSTKKKSSTKKSTSKTASKSSTKKKVATKKLDIELPTSGKLILIDLKDIKPVTWKDVVERKGRFSYHMTPSSKGGWFIKKSGNDGPSAYVVDHDEALELAKKYATKEKCTLKVHNKKGTIVESFSFGHTTTKK